MSSVCRFDLIMAISADGFIARASDELIDWTTAADKQFFRQKTKELGAVVLGRKTFQTLPHPLPERFNVVLTRQPQSIPEHPSVWATSDSPPEIQAQLTARGFARAAVIGGQELNTLFWNAGLIDRLFLSIQPCLLGQGLNLFGESILPAAQLELEKTHTFPSTSNLLLQYRVNQ